MAPPAPAAAASKAAGGKGKAAASGVKKESGVAASKKAAAASDDSVDEQEHSSNSSVSGEDGTNGGGMQTAAEATAAAASALAAAASAAAASTGAAPASVVLPGASLPLPMPAVAPGLQASSIMQQHRQAGVGVGVSPAVNMLRFSTMGPHGHITVGSGGQLMAPGISALPPMGAFPGAPAPNATGTSSPPPFSRQVTRPTALGGAGGAVLSSEWRALVSVEERIAIRRKVREAYFRRCPTYESLLDTVTAVDEELLFACSAARIDYFKAAIDWDARIHVKRQQLTKPQAAALQAVAAANGQGSEEGESTALAGRKRAAEETGGTLPATSILEGFSNADLTGAGAGLAPAAASLLSGASLPLPPVSASLFPTVTINAPLPPPPVLPAAAAAADQPAVKKQRT